MVSRLQAGLPSSLQLAARCRHRKGAHRFQRIIIAESTFSGLARRPLKDCFKSLQFTTCYTRSSITVTHFITQRNPGQPTER